MPVYLKIAGRQVLTSGSPSDIAPRYLLCDRYASYGYLVRLR